MSCFQWFRQKGRELYDGLTTYKGQFSVRTLMYSTLCAVSTWAFVYIVLHHADLITTYFVCWSGTMLGHDFAKDFIKRKLGTSTQGETK